MSLSHKCYRLYLCRSRNDPPEQWVQLSTLVCTHADQSSVVVAGTVDPYDLCGIPYGCLVLEDSKGQRYYNPETCVPKEVSFIVVHINKKEPLDAKWVVPKDILNELISKGECFGVIVLCEAFVERFIRDLVRHIFESEDMVYEPFERTSVAVLNEFLYKSSIIDKSVYEKIERLIEKRNEFVHRRTVESYSDNVEKVKQILNDGLEALDVLWKKIKEKRRTASNVR